MHPTSAKRRSVALGAGDEFSCLLAAGGDNFGTNAT
jgi:hypothetical protein